MNRQTRRLWSILTLSVVSGCQCFTAVDEPDGGEAVDGGVDAGRADAGRTDAGSVDAGTVDAGPDAGCARATQCTSGPQPTTQWCNTSRPDAGYSCIERTCLWECPIGAPGRNCIVDQGSYCLRCGDAGTACPLTTNCGGPSTSITASVESGASCTTWPGTNIPFTEVTLMRTASAQCRYLASGVDGGQSLGEVWRLNDGEYLANFPGLGGWCTGRSAFTGVPRGIFNCPACQFVLMGFE